MTLLTAYCHTAPSQRNVCLKRLSLIIPFSLFSPVFDLLPSSSQRPNPAALQPILTDPTLNEVYVISTFKLHTKSSATIFGLYSSTDNSKYFEFTVMGRLNKGKHICRNHFLKTLFLFQLLGSTCLKMVPSYSLSLLHHSFQLLYLDLYGEGELLHSARTKTCLWPSLCYSGSSLERDRTQDHEATVSVRALITNTADRVAHTTDIYFSQ